jgi:hypothetical protein
MDIDAVLDAYELPEHTVQVCLKGSLVAEYEQLDQRLQTADRDASSLSAPAEAVQIAWRMQELREQMLAASRTFRFRGLAGAAYSQLLESHKNDKGELSEDTWPPALIVASCVDPVMTQEKAQALRGKVTDRQWQDLYDAALAVNRQSVSVPFSNLASAVLRTSPEN